jgi:DNA-binding beta-propeller fold protein YncE
VATNLGNNPTGITFDGARVWTVNDNSVSIVTPGASIPWTVTTVTVGFSPGMAGAVYDGASVWVTDFDGGKLDKLDANGAILQTVTVQTNPALPVFDGTNIWVPNIASNSVSVVRASNGAVLTTLTGNGLNAPTAAAFDGQRVLITNYTGSSVSLWKAADLTTLGTFSVGTTQNPWGACSDGASFWVVLHTTPGHLARF